MSKANEYLPEMPQVSNASAIAAKIPTLSRALQEIIEGIARGLKNKDIATEHGIGIDAINGRVNRLYRALGIGGLPSYRLKRQLAMDAYKLHIAAVEAKDKPPPPIEPPPADLSVPTDAERLKKLNGGGGTVHPNTIPEEIAEISHPPVAAAGESGGYGVASVIRVHNPAPVVGIRTLTLSLATESQITQLLNQGFIIEELVDYQSLTAPDVSITRAILVKRRR